MDDEDAIRTAFTLPQLPHNTGFKYLHYHLKEDLEHILPLPNTPLPPLPANNHVTNVTNEITKQNDNNNVSTSLLPHAPMLIADNGSSVIDDSNESTACNNTNLSLVNGSTTKIVTPSTESSSSPVVIDSTSYPTTESSNRIDDQANIAEEWRAENRSSTDNLKRKLSDAFTGSSVEIASISTAGQTFDDEATLSAPVSPKCIIRSCDEYEAMKQHHRPSFMGNSAQSGGVKSFLNPFKFKNTEEMKHFIKHQLQFSDLGKLFEKIDFSLVGPGHLNDYAQFLGLQPTVKFKCFDSKFEPLELKEHQLILLQRNIKAHSGTATSEVFVATSSRNTEMSNQLNEAMTQPKSTPSREDSAIPASTSTIENSNCIDTKFRNNRKVYLCSACGTYYENWNLFRHMREVHKKCICLQCLVIFPNAEKLVHHLEFKHANKPDIYEHKEQLLQAFRGLCYLMCFVCEHIFSQTDDFTSHSCDNYIQACGLCGLKFIHKRNCRAGVPLGGLKNQKPNNHRLTARSAPSTNKSNKNKCFFRRLNNLNADDYLEKPYTKQTSISTSEEALSPPVLNESINRPLLVPKLKLKISKEFQTPLGSEESSTEDEDDSSSQSGPTAPQLISAELSQSPSHRTETTNNVSDRGSVHMDIEYNSSVAEDRVEDCNDVEDEDVNTEEFDTMKPSNLIPINVLPPPQLSPPPDDIAESPEKRTEPSNGITLAGEDEPLLEILLNQPLDLIPTRQLLRTCLKASYSFCLYCNHARKIAVDGNSLGLHLLAHHRFAATVDSITGEELQPSTIIQRLKSSLEELNGCFFNLDSYDNCDSNFTIPYEKSYECLQCRFYARIYKDLYHHNRKMHLKLLLHLCLMCKSNFYSYSELVCHMCPGASSKVVLFELKFRCVLCQLDFIPSAFRLMVHLRKKHLACDVCLEECTDQRQLSSHVGKHKPHHLCYRCNISYRNKADIANHLFWKHGTESYLCKKCLQKKWPHIYHFCIPSSTFICEVCNLTFSRAVALKVHKRLHSDDHPYTCTEDDCEKKFISRKLLLKHVARHIAAVAELEKPPAPSNVIEEVKENTTIAIKLELPEPIFEATSKEESTIRSDGTKKKSTKLRKHKNSPVITVPKNILDIIDLPAPNLSESDSSDELDNEKATMTLALSTPPAFEVSITMDVVADPAITADDNHTPIADIWNNFESYQTSQPKLQYSDEEERSRSRSPMPPAILHVSQSDHDYCAMYKPVSSKIVKKDEVPEAMKASESILVQVVKQYIPDQVQAVLSTRQFTPPLPPPPPPTQQHKHASPKKGRSPKKVLLKSGSDSSLGDSSDSNSSCSCGSNCSCSTSSSGSSSSSSSSDSSDSSSTDGSQTQQMKRAEKQEKRERSKRFVTPDPVLSETFMFANKTDPDLIIFESDLATDESETDEEFYDEHPQRLASELLAEKRKQLQTCMNSRPSTPSLPEEMVKSLPQQQTPPLPPMPKINFDQHRYQAGGSSFLGNPNVPDYIKYNQKPQLSTGSSGSDADAPLKRTKRRRIPNKFYGFSSDEESSGGIAGGTSLF